MKTKKKFDIERVREFCKLVNEGKSPGEALRYMNTSKGYTIPLRSAGIYWTEKDGSFKALERIRLERFELFVKRKSEYNNKFHDKEKKNYRVKQSTLFCQPKPKQPTAQKVKPNEPKLTFIQRVVKSLFNL